MKSTRVQHYITILNLQKRLKDLHLGLKLGTFRSSEYYCIIRQKMSKFAYLNGTHSTLGLKKDVFGQKSEFAICKTVSENHFSGEF